MAETIAVKPRGQRLWAVLLVLDSFFVIFFGGALAAKFYQHLLSPSVAAPGTRAGKKKAPAGNVNPEAGRDSALPRADAPKPPEAPKPEPVIAKSDPAPKPAESMHPPKPSLLNEAPKRAAAVPQSGTPSASSPAGNVAPEAGRAGAADAAPKPKAVPVDFEFSGAGAKSVELAGAFLVRGGGRKAMIERKDGRWTLTLYLVPNTYRYHFLVDGKKTLDPANQNTDRGLSVVVVPAP